MREDISRSGKSQHTHSQCEVLPFYGAFRSSSQIWITVFSFYLTWYSTFDNIIRAGNPGKDTQVSYFNLLILSHSIFFRWVTPVASIGDVMKKQATLNNFIPLTPGTGCAQINSFYVSKERISKFILIGMEWKDFIPIFLLRKYGILMRIGWFYRNK